MAKPKIIKTPQEIEIMKRGGVILSAALKAAVDAVKPGVNIRAVDKAAENKMRALGATPSFLDYKQSPDQDGFPSTVCISINDEVIHGIGTRDIVLKEGDIVGLDIGCWYQGMVTDMAVTVAVGKVNKEAQDLMDRTKQSLLEAVKQVKDGATIRSLGQAVQTYLQPFGYGIVRDFVGHGVGHALHEEPSIPNYDEPYIKGKLKAGMCIAIEPMITMSGESRVDIADDGWTVVTRDGSLAAHFEMTVAVTETGAEIVTPLP